MVMNSEKSASWQGLEIEFRNCAMTTELLSLLTTFFMLVS